jgi:methionyl-tRNA formyltransferase
VLESGAMAENKAQIVFMGSPDFARPTLQALADNFDVAGVVTQPDRPAGRGRQLQAPAVKQLAEELGLPIMQPKTLKAPEALKQLREWKPDLIVVAAFGQILRPAVLELPPKGCINVHASMLPRWRGAAPIQAAILHGDAETGITIMQMDPGLDTGPILSQRTVPIADEDTAGSLSEKLAQLGGELLIETLPGYLAGRLVPVPQDDAKSTYAPMLKKADGELDPAKPAEELARQVRAYHPWPGSFLAMPGGPLKVLAAHADAGKGGKPGQRAVRGNLPALATADGWLLLDEVQPPGKRPMSGEDYLRGARDWGNASNLEKTSE